MVIALILSIVTPAPMLCDMKGVASQKSLATTIPEKSGKVY